MSEAGFCSSSPNNFMININSVIYLEQLKTISLQKICLLHEAKNCKALV